VGIETARLEALDYETVKASGIAFGTAHNALQKTLTKSQSVNVPDDQTTIHFLAIRQLSHNLKNQKILEKTRHKVLMTRSLPRNVKYRQHSFEYENDQEQADAEENGVGLLLEGEPEAELDHDDLDLVHDDEYHYHQHKAHAKNGHAVIIDDGPPWNFEPREGPGHGARDHDKHGHTAEGNREHVPREDGGGLPGVAAAAQTPESHIPHTSPPAPAREAAAAPKGRKPRPMLSLQLTSDVSNNALPVDPAVSNNAGGQQPHIKHSQSKLHSESTDSNSTPAAHAPPKGMPSSPSSHVRVSPRGTLYMGKWKVMETGIFPDESLHRAGTGRQLVPTSGGHHLPARAHSSRDNLIASLQRAGTSNSALAASVRVGHGGRAHPLPALGGKRDFIEINTLGSGASGVVSEAIHLPSLTIVALKMLPVYNQEKRQHVSRELGVLYKNLAELRLVDDSLYQDKDPDTRDREGAGAVGPAGVAGLGGVSSPHILSLYNAFVDPRSGMINLVIEYMDGGSLEDLVQQGGCRDEKVLADIAYQTAKGLCFLHAHKSVHRDIKPANILCSTSGLIKIGDFGISKALDKTSGFANSFVGTVSYMSP
jgi:hypothetical protein